MLYEQYYTEVSDRLKSMLCQYLKSWSPLTSLLWAFQVEFTNRKLIVPNGVIAKSDQREDLKIAIPFIIITITDLRVKDNSKIFKKFKKDWGKLYHYKYYRVLFVCIVRIPNGLIGQKGACKELHRDPVLSALLKGELEWRSPCQCLLRWYKLVVVFN